MAGGGRGEEGGSGSEVRPSERKIGSRTGDDVSSSRSLYVALSGVCSASLSVVHIRSRLVQVGQGSLPPPPSRRGGSFWTTLLVPCGPPPPPLLLLPPFHPYQALDWPHMLGRRWRERGLPAELRMEGVVQLWSGIVHRAADHVFGMVAAYCLWWAMPSLVDLARSRG